MEAFPDVLERHLPKVGLHGKNGFALHFCECRSVERSWELKIWERSGGVLVLIHIVVVCRARGNVEHCGSYEGEGLNMGLAGKYKRLSLPEQSMKAKSG